LGYGFYPGWSAKHVKPNKRDAAYIICTIDYMGMNRETGISNDRHKKAGQLPGWFSSGIP
jgi:hypothetical protein